MNKFNNVMEKLSKKHDAGVIFNDFLDYYIQQHSKEEAFQNNNKYTGDELKQFQEAYNEFKKGMNNLIKEHGYYDYLGEFYEEFVVNTKKSKNKGQFFTQPEISELLTRITEQTELGVNGNKAYDCSCGSGRNLLNTYYHTHCELMGEDVDNMACRMSVVNFHVNGVCRAQVNHVDVLSQEYLGTSWLVLGDRIIVTSVDEIQAMEEILDFTRLCALDLTYGK